MTGLPEVSPWFGPLHEQPFTILLQFDYNARLEDRPLPADWDYKQFWSSYRSFSLSIAIHSTILTLLRTTFVSAYPHSFDNKQRTFLIHMHASLSTIRNCNAWMCLWLVVQMCSTILWFIWFQDHIIYAQDESKRDVVIKIIKTGSNEERIHNLLLGQPRLFNGVLPTIELIPSPHTFSFVVTPRFGGLLL
jgi:hypothetical protein